jgi:phosphoglucomutase
MIIRAGRAVAADAASLRSGAEWEGDLRVKTQRVQDLYSQWLQQPNLPEDLKAELESIADDPQAIQDRFFKDLEFGTGGLRGILGAGTNRMNVFTVRRATAGLARWLKRQGETAAERGVVIGYDCRRMSREFAEETGRVLAAHGIRAFVFDHLCPTPELSFAVRSLGAAAGVMITASHNPPEYNGYKVYGPDGGQILPDVAAQITAEINAVGDPFAVPALDRTEAESRGLLRWVGAEMDDAYVTAVVDAVAQPGVTAADRAILRIVYTPLHGTGLVPVREALRRAGYTQVTIVSAQEQPNGEFPTTRSPNPEEPEALELALQVARDVDADLVMGTDPDCDRVGIAIRTAPGEYRLLTGNQTGGLLTWFLLESRQKAGTLPANGVVIKTHVTSELGAEYARKLGVAVEDTLTGFKYIGARITDYERTGEREFLFGYEESYGYLVSGIVRDKDGVQGALAIAEMAAAVKRDGRTLADALEALYQEVGYFQEQLVSRTLPGADGLQKIRGVMETLRREGLAVDGLQLEAVEDYKTLERRWVKPAEVAAPAGAGVSAAGTTGSAGTQAGDSAQGFVTVRTERMDFASSDVLKYLFRGGSWLAVRPSGTEPKIKLYLGARGASHEECDSILARMREAVDRLLARF